MWAVPERVIVSLTRVSPEGPVQVDGQGTPVPVRKIMKGQLVAMVSVWKISDHIFFAFYLTVTTWDSIPASLVHPTFKATTCVFIHSGVM